jgi:hypothetical protein
MTLSVENIFCVENQKPNQMSGAPNAGSLVENQKTLRGLTDDYTDPTTNEGNLLSLITLKNIVGEPAGVAVADQKINALLKNMAKEETRHLLLAMKILTHTEGGDAVVRAAAAKLQDKYGRDMTAAVKLAKVLKAKADEKEVDMMLSPFVLSDLNTKGDARVERGGFQLPNNGVGHDGFAYDRVDHFPID